MKARVRLVRTKKVRVRTPSWRGRFPVVSAWQARMIARKLLELGFTQADIASLTLPDASRLCSWVDKDHWRSFAWFGVAAGALYGLYFGLLAYVTSSAPAALGAIGAAVGAFLFFAIIGPAGSDWLQGVVDRYFWFGRSGADLVRAMSRTAGSTLSRKESAIRHARVWFRAGQRRGLDVDGRAKRIFTVLGESPIGGKGQTEAADLVRESLLDAIRGKVDPLAYEMPSALASGATASAGHRAAILTQVLGVVAAAVGLLVPILGLLDGL